MAKANTKKATPTVNHPTTPEEKKKALDTAMEQIIKNYGQGAVMFLGGEGNKKLDVESVIQSLKKHMEMILTRIMSIIS